MTYIQGFLIPVPEQKKSAYKKMAEEAISYFKRHGALRIVECWEEDVRDGKATDFRRAVQADSTEKIVFSWVVWPDKQTCDAAEKAMMSDDAMPMPDAMPFDGRRLIFGGFSPIVDSNEEFL